MPTKTTVLSPNASVISFAQGSLLPEIMTAVTDEITKKDGADSVHGWELHDSAAGVNAICYRAKNKDDETYKYAVLDYGVAGTTLKVTGYGSWDELTHTGTSQAGYPLPAQAADVKLDDRGNIYLFISPRWLALCIKQFSSPVILNTASSGIIGVFETARDNPDDTVAAGYPPFVVINTAVAGDNTSTTLPTCVLPKTMTGDGNQAGEFSTIFGKSTTSPAFRLNQFTPNVSNVFSNKDWAITPYVHGANNEIKGRVFGLKLYTRNRLYFMDKVAVKCDSDYMYDADALGDTDHYIIPGGTAANGVYDVRFLLPI